MQSMINPTTAKSNYSQLTNAVIRGEATKLQASKEKNARIRASLAEVEMNNRTSADAQAAWMGAIDQNEDLLNALNSAPPRIQKAYKKATQGRATLEDNSVISSYLGSIQKQIGLEAEANAGSIKNDLVEAQIAQANAARDASKASAMVSNAELGAMQNPGVDPRMATINTILGNPQASGDPRVVAANSGGGAPVPPVSSINASDPNDPVARPVSGVALPEPGQITPQQAGQNLINLSNQMYPTAASQAPVEASAETPEVDPNAPFLTDAQGNRVVASPQAISSPEVEREMATGLSQGAAVERVQGRMDVKKRMNEYVNGRGNTENLPTANVYTAQLYAATGDLDDAREQTTAAIAQGIVYAGPTSKEKAERQKEFKESYKKEMSGLSALLSDTQIVQNASERVESNNGMFTSGFIGATAVKAGLDFPFDGGNAVEMQRAISQLTSSSALSTMDELKRNSKQGATGLGQVAVKEFEALMDKASSINQYLQPKDLLEAVNLYVYDRNKLAYSTYRSMVDQYGTAAVNSQPGISSRQISRILQDIHTFETTQAAGIKIAGRNGYFMDNVGVPQAPVIIQSGPDGGTPAPEMSKAERREQSIAAAEAVFEQEKKERIALNAANQKKALGVGSALLQPANIPASLASGFVVPKIYDFFGGRNAETDAYSSNIPNIKTK